MEKALFIITILVWGSLFNVKAQDDCGCFDKYKAKADVDAREWEAKYANAKFQPMEPNFFDKYSSEWLQCVQQCEVKQERQRKQEYEQRLKLQQQHQQSVSNNRQSIENSGRTSNTGVSSNINDRNAANLRIQSKNTQEYYKRIIAARRAAEEERKRKEAERQEAIKERGEKYKAKMQDNNVYDTNAIKKASGVNKAYGKVLECKDTGMEIGLKHTFNAGNTAMKHWEDNANDLAKLYGTMYSSVEGKPYSPTVIKQSDIIQEEEIEKAIENAIEKNQKRFFLYEIMDQYGKSCAVYANNQEADEFVKKTNDVNLRNQLLSGSGSMAINFSEGVAAHLEANTPKYTGPRYEVNVIEVPIPQPVNEPQVVQSVAQSQQLQGSTVDKNEAVEIDMGTKEEEYGENFN